MDIAVTTCTMIVLPNEWWGLCHFPIPIQWLFRKSDRDGGIAQR
jgi:hypothetical protein